MSFHKSAIVAGVVLVAFSGAVEARIKCRNGAQFVDGNYLVTPYCQDKLLAQVAREYGMRVSDGRIRNNPNFKREVCRLVGQDIRISEHCLNERPSIRSGGGGH